MVNERVNVLVYSGAGVSSGALRHSLYSLRRLLSPNYAVIPIKGEAIIKEPWTTSCALLVFPGGEDVPYCRTLNGEGNRRIIQYVSRGGNYLGFCAGGYYGSRRCEFEVGNKKMEVVGNRELAFFPDTCRGLAFPGYVYNSEAGARAAKIKVHKAAFPLSSDSVPEEFRVYYNGGGVFVDSLKYQHSGVEVLASYTEQLNVDPGEGSAAVVSCRVGDGKAILTGIHPEFAAINLRKRDDMPEYSKAINGIAEDDSSRESFLRACLLEFGLRVNEEPKAVPPLSNLHLSSHQPLDVVELVGSWQEIVTTTSDGKEYIKGENDTFHLESSSELSMDSIAKTLPSTSLPILSGDIHESDKSDRIPDYNKIAKKIISYEASIPSREETPHFDHEAYYSHLERYNRFTPESASLFGKYLLYGEVMTSTNTVLEKNTTWLNLLPSGFTALATTQVAGRGRGNNVWVAPPGSLLFSTVIRHSLSLSQSAPVVFIQYLAALATVKGIQTYGPGYSRLGVKLKWPNDVYALHPSAAANQNNATMNRYVKISGILVNTSYSGGDYTLVVGIGINVANAAPTTSLDALAAEASLPAFEMEKLLARILVCFEELYSIFRRSGWNRELEDLYYEYWLHTDQIVTLEAGGGVRARIKGITRDWGLLLAEELSWGDRITGRVWQLQSDSNSFDFFKGLIKSKV